jgi:YVTN family beta-propeller protein
MASGPSNIVICFVVLLSVVFCTVALSYSAGAQVSSNTLESIANKDIEVSPQVIVGKLPIFIDIASDLEDIYVVNAGSDTVSVIDRTTSSVKKDIPVEDNPRYLSNM